MEVTRYHHHGHTPPPSSTGVAPKKQQRRGSGVKCIKREGEWMRNGNNDRFESLLNSSSEFVQQVQKVAMSPRHFLLLNMVSKEEENKMTGGGYGQV